MNGPRTVSIVYDEACPVCRNIVHAARLRERTARLELIDARTQRVDAVQGRDLSRLDFDRAFAVLVDGEIFYAASGARALALLTEPTGIAFRIFRLLAASDASSRLSYPLMRGARAVLLKLLRIGPIEQPPRPAARRQSN
jgi:predicted DCC family thiol-disulfide oxidoreductase YuxK